MDIRQELKKLNTGFRVKIRLDKKRTKYVVMLDVSANGQRLKQSTHLYIPIPVNRKDALAALRTAHQKRIEFERQYMTNPEGFSFRSAERKSMDLIEYWKKFAEQKPDPLYKQSLDRFLEFAGRNHIPWAELDRPFCREYMTYIDQRYKSNHYFKYFRLILNEAVRDEFLESSPAKDLHLKYTPPKRQYLTIEEIGRLWEAPCPSQDLKHGFLFACRTGLRKGDLNKITFDDIDGDYLYIRTSKTGEALRILLDDDAKYIIEQQRKRRGSGNIFKIQRGGRATKELRTWLQNAEIKKEVTFHTSRHTFAMLLLQSGTGVYTVSGLLGHRNVKTTQIYARIVDDMKDKAIRGLPSISAKDDTRD